MDIAEIIDLFLDENGKKKYGPIIDLAVKNGFDLNKIMQNIDIKTLLPLLGGLFSGAGKEAAKPTAAAEANPLAPVLNIADREIVYALNRYIASSHEC